MSLETKFPLRLLDIQMLVVPCLCHPMTWPGFLFWPMIQLLLMWHYFNDAGQGLMIAGIVQIPGCSWIARHLEPDLHTCDTLLCWRHSSGDITHVWSHVWCGAHLWPVNTRRRGWYTLISETMTAHGMVLIISLLGDYCHHGCDQGGAGCWPWEPDTRDHTISSRYLFC